MKTLPCLIGLIMAAQSPSQQPDSVNTISGLSIETYRKPARLMAATKAVSIVNEELLQQNTPGRMLESVNQVAGARMEERSPGSYRLAIRGSSLRSPFGVRNVKIYLDDFILTDVSGNTYLNILSPELVDRMEIYKGPEGGDFGSVTGGTLLLKTKAPMRSPQTSLPEVMVRSMSVFFWPEEPGNIL